MSERSADLCPHAARCEMLTSFSDEEARAGFAAVCCYEDAHACARKQRYDAGEDVSTTLLPSGVDLRRVQLPVAEF